MEKNEIKSIEFIFENCESIEIPIEYFTKIDFKGLNKYDNDTAIFEKFECVIEDKGNIEYSNGFDCQTPIQRINYYNDITNIYIKYEDNSFVKIACPWYNPIHCPNSNLFQSSNSNKSNIVELSIIKDCLNYNAQWISLSDVLNTLEDGTKIKDQDGKIYTVYFDKKDNATYLFNTTVNNKLLNSKFQKVS
jgi:hypothetical protein